MKLAVTRIMESDFFLLILYHISHENQVYWKEVYGIDITYKEDIWQVTDRALKGESGVFTHNSYKRIYYQYISKL